MILGAMDRQLRYSVRERRLGRFRAHGKASALGSRVPNRRHQPRSV